MTIGSATTSVRSEMSRRGFLVSMAGGLALGFFLPGGNRLVGAAAAQQQINSYVRVGTDGRIVLSFGGSEMGQGSMSGLAQILAEELMVDWSQVIVEQSVADAGISYITGGSSAVSNNYGRLRTAGATARELLIAAAMTVTGDTTRSRYSAKTGVVTYTNPPSSASWSYGDLATMAASAAAQALLPNPVPLTADVEFRLIGKPLPRVDIPPKTSGSAVYGIDVRLPGMVYAAIKHCPTIGGTMATAPATPSGAIAVVPCKASDARGAVAAGSYNAVAVVADNTWKAGRLARSLSVKWNLPALTASVDSASLLATAKQVMTGGPFLVAEPNNPPPAAAAIDTLVDNAMAGAKTMLDATYVLPFLAHAPMEVLNCTVNLTFDSTGTPTGCEIWAPTQAAMWVVGTAAGLTKLPTASIKVHTTLLGGGLGRKIEQDNVSQAIQVALAVKGSVKLTWFREEDFAHDQYRPMALVRGRAGLDAQNNIVAWSYRNVSPAILGQRGWLPPGAPDSQAVEGAVALPYALGTHVVEWAPLPSGIPIGFWRSVGSSINTFAVESMIDELALQAGLDPFAFRYKVTTEAKTLAVLRAADSLSSWRKSLPAGHGWGVAVAEWFGTVVAEVVDVSQPAAGSLKVHRVACVVDCGIVINPDSVEAQMQGGIAHGLSAALWGQMTFVNGVAKQTNFNKYRSARLSEMPQITVQILRNSNPPSGIGEPAVPPIAPALANAYAKLTGVRIRTLPFFPGATMGGL